MYILIQKHVQHLAWLLDQSVASGEVKIKRKDGQMFVVKPAHKQKSPLDVKGINLGLSQNEIIEYIHEGRRM